MNAFDNFRKLLNVDFIKNEILPEDTTTNEKKNPTINFYNRFSISMYNYYAVTYIYSTYIRPYGHDFIQEKATRTKNKKIKYWVLYALSKYQSIIEDENNSFESELYDLTHRLGIPTNLNFIEIFQNHMPFFNNYDIFKFAYDNFDSPLFEYFYLLIIIHYQDKFPEDIFKRLNYQTCCRKDKCEKSEKCRIKNISKNTCLYQELTYGEDYNFSQEFTNFQDNIVSDFIHTIPNEIKIKALTKLQDAFQQINQTNILDKKLTISFEKFLYKKDNPLTGEFFITWDKVDFYDGFYLIRHPNVPLNTCNSLFKKNDTNSRKVFNHINKLFLKCLMPLHVHAQKGKIIDILNETDLGQCISLMEYKVNATFTKKATTKKLM